ncbi:MAG: amylo-alpha-1,6-glucosidase [bacterium]
MIRFTQEDLKDFEANLAREYLETNGIGGYSSSTVLGLRTRKYHGLLISAQKPPLDRLLMVADFEETLLIRGKRIDLSKNEYLGAIHPQDNNYLTEFSIDPLPRWIFEVYGITLTKTVFMCQGENTTCVIYEIRSSGEIRASEVLLELKPITAIRSHHNLISENEEQTIEIEVGPTTLRVERKGIGSFTISFKKGRFEYQPCWYRNYHYRRESEYGYPSREDLFCPGRMVFPFANSTRIGLAISTNEMPIYDIEERKQKEIQRRNQILRYFGDNEGFVSTLGLAADAFIVERGDDGCSIIAGYPWFADWGRDAMISLPGLCLATGRYDQAKKIIKTFIDLMRDGLIPNCIPESGDEPAYNTIDATLWLFEAVWKYYETTGDGEFIIDILPALRNSIQCHLNGTRYGIRVDEDGLLMGGVEGVQLTWMDAKVGDIVITARIGKPVEVNALWYNALRIMSMFSSTFGALADESHYDILATRVHQSFNEKFWNQEKRCLYDCLTKDGADSSIRPNQIFAISLTHPVLLRDHWQDTISVVEAKLLTPFGLRTLSPDDHRYRGWYSGDIVSRDNAYHQGTVWPWLLGHYLEAYLKTYGTTAHTIAYCYDRIQAFSEHLRWAGLGTISEIFDGDSPHLPNGCIAQAWSVAEILRISQSLSRSLNESSIQAQRAV